jgi:phosphonate metabolism-associated iron-containing alcohol dehydrogenase
VAAEALHLSAATADEGALASFVWKQPVQVRFGAGAAAAVAAELGARPALVLAFAPARALGIADDWITALGDRLIAWIDVADGLSTLARAAQLAEEVWPLLAEHPEAVLIGLGGGTTLDLAKVVRCRPRDGDSSQLTATLRDSAAWPSLRLAPLWLIPTTAGTGSEVTRWATVWDTGVVPAQKRSFDEPFGYADRAFVDATLTLSCPASVTRDCGLDSLAHALEAIWNRHANPISDALALAAAERIVRVLPALLQQPSDARLRSEMSLAALQAGLAFAQTRTALAHALSYAVTLEQGVPHGHACALWLPTVFRLAVGHDPRVDGLLARLFDGGGAAALAVWLRDCGVDPRPEAVGIADADQRLEGALHSARGSNFIGSPAIGTARP